MFAPLRGANARVDCVERPVHAAPRREPIVRPDKFARLIGRFAPIIRANSPVNSRILCVNEMEWKEIITQADADTFMDLVGGFHDGCIREAHLCTDHWVSSDLSMSCPGNLDNRIRFLIQRQFRNPAAVELLFEEVTRFNLVPTPENYDTIIYGATLLVRNDTIYWSTDGRWSPDSSDRDESTWISAKKLRWHEVDWLGEKLHYGPNE